MYGASIAEQRLQSIQTEFMQLSRRHFQDVWEAYVLGRASAERAEKVVARYLRDASHIVTPSGGRLVTSLHRRVEELLQDVDHFWNQHRNDIKDSISKADGLGVLVGDIDAVSDLYSEAVLNLGLYFDSLYLVEPMSVAAQRIRKEPQLLEGKDFAPTAVRLLVALLRVRELFEELPPDGPSLIMIFVPIGGLEWGDSVFDRIFAAATRHTNLLLSRVFEHDISEPSDFMEGTKLLGMKEFESRLRSDPAVGSILTDFETYEQYAQAHAFEMSQASELRKYLGDAFKYFYVYPDVQSKMLSLESSEVFASWLRIDASTRPDKQLLNVDRVDRNRQCGERVGLREGEVAAHALLGGDLTWLLPSSLSELKSFRHFHTLERIRELFRVGRRTLQNAGPLELQAASEEMVHAVYAAVQEAVKELERGRKADMAKLGLRVVQVASSIGLSFLTTVFNLPLTLSLPISALVPTWTLWDLSKTESDSLRREQELFQRPAFMALNFEKRRALNRCLPLLSDGRRPGDLLGI